MLITTTTCSHFLRPPSETLFHQTRPRHRSPAVLALATTLARWRSPLSPTCTGVERPVEWQGTAMLARGRNEREQGEERLVRCSKGGARASRVLLQLERWTWHCIKSILIECFRSLPLSSWTAGSKTQRRSARFGHATLESLS